MAKLLRTPLSLAGSLLFAFGATGCGSGADEPGDFDPSRGEVVATLTSVPADGICLVLTFTNGVATSYNALTAGNSTTAISLGKLPAGSITITPKAYNVVSGSCNSTSITSSTVPTWVGVGTVAQVTPGVTTTVALTLRPNTTVTSGVDFAPVARAIAAGSASTYALLSDGTIRAWGYNTNGELGNNSNVSSSSPVAVTMGASFVAASSLASVGRSVNHMCAIKASNSAAWCWGGNWNGQLGTGNTTNSLVPVAVTGGQTYSAITIGSTTSWGINAATKLLWGWGSTFGNGTPTQTSTPITLSAAGYEKISGNAQTIFVLSGNKVWAAGTNNFGQLGVGDTNNVYFLTSTYFAAGLWPVAVSAGYMHSCAVVSPNNIVQCAGNNLLGQLGDGTHGASAMPVTTVGLNGVTSLSSGSYHSCAIMADGTIRCWGSNTNGQLGDGTATNSSVPVQVANIYDAVSVVAADSYTCALRADATVWCWGSNSFGQLGDGTTFDRMVPTKALL